MENKPPSPPGEIRLSGNISLPTGSGLPQISSSELLGTIIELFPDAVVVCRKGRVIMANSLAMRLFGATSQNQLTGGSPVDSTHPSELDVIKKKIEQAALECESSAFFERTLLVLDGRTVNVEVSAVPLMVDGALNVILVVRDITAHKRLELALTEREESFRRLSEAATEGIAITRKGKIIEVNQRILEITGFTREELLNKNSLEMVAPESLNEVMKNISLGLEEPYEVIGLKKDGGRFPAEVTGRNVILDGETARIVIVRDLTCKRESERKLKESEAKFRTLVETADDAIILMDTDFNRLYENEAAFKGLGYTKEEWEKQGPFWERLHPDDMATIREEMAALLKSGKSTVKYRIRHKDGHYITRLAKSKTLYADGKPYAALSILRDITDMERADEELRESHERFKALVENIDNVFWLIQLNPERVLYVSPAFEKWWGMPAEKIYANPRGWADTIHADDKARTQAAFDDWITGRAAGYDVEYRIALENGAVRWIHARGAFIRKKNGARQWVCGVAEDITERKMGEDEIHKSHRLLDALNKIQSVYIEGRDAFTVFSNLLEIIRVYTNSSYGFLNEYVTDDGDRPYLVAHAITDLSWNEETREFYEKNKLSGIRFYDFSGLNGLSIVTGKPLISLDPSTDPRSKGTPPGHPRLDNFISIPYFKDGKILGNLGLANRKEGFDEKFVEDLGPLMTATANIVQAFTNERRRIKFEKELEEARDRAEGATRLKDQFVSLVAHDLRSPFSSMMGLLRHYAEQQNDPPSPNAGDELELILQSGDRMVGMIDNLLKISRLQTGAIKPQFTFFNGRAAVALAISSLAYNASRKGVHMINNVPEGMRLYADLSLFGEVMMNLLSNAVKFCSKGDRITVFAPPETESVIAVGDTGMGISPDFSPNLFRGDIKTTMPGSAGELGAGLGLPYSYDIMKAHGGDLKVESVPGDGSVFYAILPFVKPVAVTVTPDDGEAAPIMEALEKMGVETLVVADGEKALSAIKAKAPHLVIIGAAMGGAAGFDLLARLKEDGFLKGIPVIMMGDDENVKTRDKAMRLGADDFMGKSGVMEGIIPRVRRFVT